MKLSKEENIARHRAIIENLNEDNIFIEFRYDKPALLRKILGLNTIVVNEFEFMRALRLTDIDGNWPSFRSTMLYPGILIKYFIQKILKKYIVHNPKPFIVVDAVSYIDNFISDNCKVLEVGAGNSTLWFLNKGCQVLSIEHDKEWATEIEMHAKCNKSISNTNFEIRVSEGKEALKFMSELNQKFDIILIDSMNAFTSRYESIKILKEKLSINGILILDNSDGPVNWKAMSEMGNIRNKKTFTGFAYNSSFVCQTTIWKSSDIFESIKRT